MFHRPVVTHRYFFALRPPPLLARRVVNAAPWFEGGGAVAEDRLHVTMFILDDLPRRAGAVEDVLRTVGDRLAAAPIDIWFDQIVGTGQSIALRPRRTNQRLKALHRSLTELARAAGISERASYRSSPHVTLGYRTGGPFNMSITPIGRRADEIVLIHSHVGQTRQMC